MGPMCIPYFESYNSLLVVEDGKRRFPKLHPTFKIGSDARQANELLIQTVLKEVSNPSFEGLYG